MPLFQPQTHRHRMSLMPPIDPNMVLGTITEVSHALTTSDEALLSWVCQMAVEGNGGFVDIADWEAAHPSQQDHAHDATEAAHRLARHGLVTCREAQDVGNHRLHLAPTTLGFELYATRHLNSYDALVRSVVDALVNHHKDTDESIASHMGQPLFMVQHILKALESAGHLQVTGALSGPRKVFNIGPWCRVALGTS